jgi:hypothetical protein
MIRLLFILLILLPKIVCAQDFRGYRTTSLDAVVDEWSTKTKSEGPGYSFSHPEKIRFVATLREAPRPCSNATLATILKMMNFSDLLKQASITHCVGFTSSKGRAVFAYVQDALVPGLNTDARIGSPVEIYADFLAYQVSADRSRDMPVMLVNRFEPK